MQHSDAMPAALLDLKSEYRLPKTIPQLDRLRGLAISLVVIFHCEHVAPQALDGIVRQGWMGVDLFFVLSGFLITGILLDTSGSKDYFLHFYKRRILRIWPVYLLILFFAFCFVPFLRWAVGGPLLGHQKESLGVWAFLLMIQNLVGVQLFYSPFLGVTWSLAIEEQFYLVWPAVIRFTSRRVVLPCLLIAFFLEPLIRVWAMHRGLPQEVIYYNPLTHGDGLLCGAIVAVWLRSAKPRRKTLLLAGCTLLLAGLTLFALIHPSSPTSRYYSPLVITSVALLSVGLLLVALVSENLGNLPHRLFFMNRTLAFLGFISYSLYLYHFPILRIAMSDRLAAMLHWWNSPQLTEYFLTACGIGLSILFAWFSRVTLERFALSKMKSSAG